MSAAVDIEETPSRRNDWVWLGILTAILVASLVWHPQDDGGFVICLLRRATGFPCPGCGLTRSFCALGKGDVARAFHFHALGPVLYAMAILAWLRGVAAVAGMKTAVARFDRLVLKSRIVPVVLGLMLVAWIVKLLELAGVI